MIHPEATVDECMEEISALEAGIERLTRELFITKQERDAACVALGDALDGSTASRLASEVERLRAAGEFFIWVMDQKLFMPDLMLEAADKMRAAIAGKEKKMSDPRSPRVRAAEETILDLYAKIEQMTRGLNFAKVTLMNRRVLGNVLIPDYEVLAAAAEAEVDVALVSKERSGDKTP